MKPTGVISQNSSVRYSTPFIPVVLYLILFFAFVASMIAGLDTKPTLFLCGKALNAAIN